MQHVRERDGQLKKTFASEADADAWNERRRSNYHGDAYRELTPYRCLHCHGWHVGTARSAPRHRQNTYRQQWAGDRELAFVELGTRAVVSIEAENAAGPAAKRRRSITRRHRPHVPSVPRSVGVHA